mgnify:CR=1 FL=1
MKQEIKINLPYKIKISNTSISSAWSTLILNNNTWVKNEWQPLKYTIYRKKKRKKSG